MHPLIKAELPFFGGKMYLYKKKPL